MTTEILTPRSLHFWGLDRSPKDRPGVPKEHAPRPVGHAPSAEPDKQAPREERPLVLSGLSLTPVFSTAEPPRGLSGALRRWAYTIPDHRVRHWLVLMAADRVDVIEHNPARALLPLAVGAAVVGTLVLLGRRR